MNITVSAYNRPAYLRQVLEGLRRCDRIDHHKVTVILDQCEETAEQRDICEKLGFAAVMHAEHAGCNRAIFAAFAFGFDSNGAAADFHLHLEDDTVPTRDALRWFEWAAKAYRENPAVLNVSGYQRVSNGRLDECGLRRWFTPWGWATWRDRWNDLAAGWVKNSATSWDVVVNHVLRAGRYEVFPTVSRIQNIGAEKGTHVPSAAWHAANHHVPITADDMSIAASFPVTAWTQTRVDDAADHA